MDELYPNPPIPLNSKNHFQLLVAVLLSAQCTDERVNKVTPELFKLAGDPFKMQNVPVEEIYSIIRPCGLAPKKSKAISELSAILVEKYNGEIPKEIDLAPDLENNAEDHGGVRVIAARTAMDAGSVKDMVFKLKGQGNTLVIFANAWEGKATVSIGISDEVVAHKGWHAGNAVRALAQHIKGGGGGQPAFATAGGKNPEGLDKVLSDWKNHFAL